MLTPITDTTITQIANPAFREYARTYLAIEEDYRTQIASFGLPFAAPITEKRRRARADLVARMAARGLSVSNGGMSLHANWISQSCVQCRKGLDTVTFLISVQCPKHCYFCFNPNQYDYERLLTETHDVVAELEEYHDHGRTLTDLALTGGEPLVHKAETVRFFARASELYPEAYTRLYTSGSYLDDVTLEALRDSGLDEIRFSVKLDEPPAARAALLDLMERAKAYIEHVMVEMPVMPDGVEEMDSLLADLDRIGITGINLLELCYPLHNAEEFARRGYLIKNPPYNVLYDYWYAGGLPIDGSDEACLAVLDHALERGLSIGLHYCSLENKFTGQIYQQNAPYARHFPSYTMSPRDRFLKTAKVFGDDIARVEPFFRDRDPNAYNLYKEEGFFEFKPNFISQLAAVCPGLEIALSYNVIEERDGMATLRELRVDYTTPERFELAEDL